ncbi:hypothetical protein GCM10011512_08900 [Tersicoccus solisilvae]|uniref:Tetratricopeptide repeat protein n=1 Tax=Tersicoccus solisilvae TaxID=1882339 RepID=A0ABQ1NSQ2_9MICC|nr:hypothetical protein [Tersicoccus solisilvae]GGC84294.1 hypothetical protein GCM10011512_08900 [Tersicoccus solisilvae]
MRRAETDTMPGSPALPGDPSASDSGGWLSAADLEIGRRRVRRRLLWFSAPVVLLALLVAAKLLSLPLFGGQAADAWERQDAPGVGTAAERLGVVNVVEPYKAHVAAGDADVLRSDWEGARTEFTRALELVGGGVNDCPVRVNLVLAIEKRGDELTGQGRAADARALYEQAQQVVGDAPPDCFEDPQQSQDSGQQLRQAEERLQDKQQAPSSPPSAGPTPSPTPGTPSPSAGPTPAPGTDPRQQELEQRQREAAQDRAPGGPQDDQNDADAPPPGAKQW